MFGFCMALGMHQLQSLRAANLDPRILILIFLCGIGVGYAGMARGERLRSLPAIGFTLSLTFLILGFFAKSRSLQ
jgi:hypothetical protein